MGSRVNCSLSENGKYDIKYNIKENLIYRLLLISSIIGYWIHIPGFNKVYFFHIMLAIYIVNEILKYMFNDKTIIVNSYSLKYISFLTIWYLYIIASYFWSNSFSLYLKFALIYTLMLIFTISIIQFNSNISKLKCSFEALGFIFIVVIAIGLLEAFGIFRLPNSPYARDLSGLYREDAIAILKSTPTVFFGNPNDLGTYLSLSMSFLLPLISFENNGRKKRMLVVVLILSLIVLVFTNSRANLLAFFLAYFSFLIITNKKIFKNILIILLVVSLILTIIIIFQDKLPYQLKNITSIFKILGNLEKKTDNSINVRLFIVEQTIGVSKDNVWGLGVGNMRHYLGTMDNSRIIDPHNWWMELLSEFGLFMFVFYLIFYVSMIVKLFFIVKDKSTNIKLKKYGAGSFIGLITLIIASTSPSSIVYFMPHWILIGLSISIISIYSKEKERGIL